MNGWTFHTTDSIKVGDCILIGYGDNVFREVISIERIDTGSLLTLYGLEKPHQTHRRSKYRIARPPEQ